MWRCMRLQPGSEKEEEDKKDERSMLSPDMSSEAARDFRLWRLFSRAETNESFLGQFGMS